MERMQDVNDDNPKTIERKRIGHARAQWMVAKASGMPADAADEWLAENVAGGAVEAWHHGAPGGYTNGEDLVLTFEPCRYVPDGADERSYLKHLEFVVADLEHEIARDFLAKPDPEAAMELESAPDHEAQCSAWLAEQMRKSPECSPRSKGEWLAEAREKFPGLSGRAFEDRAWPAAIRETGAKWGQPGRKSAR
jgi:hypothetical protein